MSSPEKPKSGIIVETGRRVKGVGVKIKQSAYEFGRQHALDEVETRKAVGSWLGLVGLQRKLTEFSVALTRMKLERQVAPKAQEKIGRVRKKYEAKQAEAEGEANEEWEAWEEQLAGTLAEINGELEALSSSRVQYVINTNVHTLEDFVDELDSFHDMFVSSINDTIEYNEYDTQEDRRDKQALAHAARKVEIKIVALLEQAKVWREHDREESHVQNKARKTLANMRKKNVLPEFTLEKHEDLRDAHEDLWSALHQAQLDASRLARKVRETKEDAGLLLKGKDAAEAREAREHEGAERLRAFLEDTILPRAETYESSESMRSYVTSTEFDPKNIERRPRHIDVERFVEKVSLPEIVRQNIFLILNGFRPVSDIALLPKELKVGHLTKGVEWEVRRYAPISQERVEKVIKELDEYLSDISESQQAA